MSEEYGHIDVSLYKKIDCSFCVIMKAECCRIMPWYLEVMAWQDALMRMRLHVDDQTLQTFREKQVWLSAGSQQAAKWHLSAYSRLPSTFTQSSSLSLPVFLFLFCSPPISSPSSSAFFLSLFFSLFSSSLSWSSINFPSIP